MTDHPRLPCAVRFVALLFAAVAVPSAGSGAPGTVLSPDGPISMGIEVRDFDGLQSDVLAFRGTSFRFVTDSLRTWTPRNNITAGDVLVFEHLQFREVTLELSGIGRSQLVDSERAWKAYLRRIQEKLGRGCSILEESDSSQPDRSLAVLGWPTREVFFSYPGPDGGEPRAERHLVACGPAGGVLIIIAGPMNQVSSAAADLRLMAARFERQ